jgi:hypothetical protein
LYLVVWRELVFCKKSKTCHGKRRVGSNSYANRNLFDMVVARKWLPHITRVVRQHLRFAKVFAEKGRGTTTKISVLSLSKSQIYHAQQLLPNMLE